MNTAFWLLFLFSVSHATSAARKSDLEDIFSSFKKTLSKPVDMSVNGTTLDFAKAVCKADIGLDQSATSADTAICTTNTALKLLNCVVEKAVENHLHGCRLSLEKNSHSMFSAYCTVFITVISSLARHPQQNSIMPIGRDVCWRFGKTFRVNGFVQLGQLLARSCQLQSQIQLFKCSTILFAEVDDKVGPSLFYIGQLFSRIALVFASASYNEHGSVKLDTMCWEGDLLRADDLYKLHGHWDLDEICVETLQTFSVSMLSAVREWFASITIHSPYSKPFYSSFGFLGEWIPYIIHAILEVLTQYSDMLLQMTVYPAFKRFLNHAEHRNARGAATVSCKGIHGNRSEVHNTVVQLVRLLIVNELHYYNFSLYSTAVGVACSHLLPCFVTYAV